VSFNNTPSLEREKKKKKRRRWKKKKTTNECACFSLSLSTRFRFFFFPMWFDLILFLFFRINITLLKCREQFRIEREKDFLFRYSLFNYYLSLYRKFKRYIFISSIIIILKNGYVKWIWYDDFIFIFWMNFYLFSSYYSLLFNKKRENLFVFFK